MLLHNQRGASVSWEANGRVFEWEPYGPCEVPDELVPHLKSEGFPVAVTPVAPKERAERAVAEAAAAQQASEPAQLRKELEQAKAQLQAALGAAEASERHANAAQADAESAARRVLALEQENAGLRKDATEYEKLLAESAAENGRLKEQLKIEQAKPAEPPKKR